MAYAGGDRDDERVATQRRERARDFAHLLGFHREHDAIGAATPAATSACASTPRSRVRRSRAAASISTTRMSSARQPFLERGRR